MNGHTRIAIGAAALALLIPLASDDPRIALIPHFGLMLVLWACTFWALALVVRALWRSNRRHAGRGGA
jgi:hypothetical protein